MGKRRSIGAMATPKNKRGQAGMPALPTAFRRQSPVGVLPAAARRRVQRAVARVAVPSIEGSASVRRSAITGRYVTPTPIEDVSRRTAAPTGVGDGRHASDEDVMRIADAIARHRSALMDRLAK